MLTSAPWLSSKNDEPSVIEIGSDMKPWEISARLGIAKLVGDYTRAVDAGDTAAIAATFVEDGVFELPGETRLAGRSAIDQGLSEFAKAMSAAREERPVSRHMTNPSLIRFLSPERAELETLFLVISSQGLVQWGRWLDVVVQQEGGWRFELHRIAVDGPAAAPAAA